MKFSQRVFPFFVMVLIAMSMTFISCDSEESDFLEVQEFGTEQSDLRGDRPDKSDRKGKRHHLFSLLKGDCLSLTYPVTILFPDGTDETVNDLEELLLALRTYRETADSTQGHPTFQYPLTITAADSTIVVNSQDELREAAKLCKRDRPNHGNRPCFRIVYPLTIEFPDDSTLQVSSKKEQMQAIRQWKANNPDSDERPNIVFPIEIKFKDGSTQMINSADELAAAREDCDED